jgi:copper transport protein
VAVVLCAVVLGGASPAGAHAVLVSSNPGAGSGLEATPTAINLTFSEEPEPSLTTIKLTGPHGAPVPLAPATPVPGDPRSVTVHVPTLTKGVYSVDWRVVSRIDGHPTAATYSFGVGVTPEQAQLANAAKSTSTSAASSVEILGRFLLLAGVVMLLGATFAGTAGFAGARRGVPLAAVAWPVTVLGLVILMIAQRSSAGVGFAAFFDTYAGRSVQGRALAVAVVGVALFVSWIARSVTIARIALAVAAAASAVMIAIHVAAGHAATSSGVARWTTTAAQWSHLAAVGIWIGGLAALLVGIRGAPSVDKTLAIRRFSVVAAVALAVVVATGVARSIVAVHSWDALVSTGYGQLILVKVALVGVIALLALRNRRRNVPAAATSLRPLQRFSAGELTLAALAIGAAAVLGSISPPVVVHPLGLTVDGVDASGTVQARLVTQWAVPGPNRFDLHLDQRGDRPLDATRVSLRFVPLDDPGVAASTLPLTRGTAPGTWVGSGNNVSFPGRWQVSAIAEQAAEARVVPLQLHIAGPPLFRSVDAFPGQPVRYSVQLADNSFIRLTAEPVRHRRQRVTVEFFEYFSEARPISQMTLTATGAGGTTRQLPVARRDASSFVSRARLDPGPTHFGVIARTLDNTRLYGTYEVDVANREK